MKPDEIEERIVEVLQRKKWATRKTIYGEIRRRWDEKLNEFEFLKSLDELVKGEVIQINSSKWTKKDKELFFISDWKLEALKAEEE